MSRYIDADELLNRLPDDLPYKASVKRVLIQTPTADVAPKSEVAREIFEKIHEEIKAALESNYKARRERLKGRGAVDNFMNVVDGKIAALRGIDDFIDYLEEKYTTKE